MAAPIQIDLFCFWTIVIHSSIAYFDTYLQVTACFIQTHVELGIVFHSKFDDKLFILEFALV